MHEEVRIYREDVVVRAGPPAGLASATGPGRCMRVNRPVLESPIALRQAQQASELLRWRGLVASDNYSVRRRALLRRNCCRHRKACISSKEMRSPRVLSRLRLEFHPPCTSPSVRSRQLVDS